MESGVEGSWQSVEEDCLSVEQTSDNGKLLEDDPFAYLNRKEFTSEKFKIEIRNLPSKCGYKDIQCLLSACGIVSRKIKKLAEVAYVTFRNEEERERAVTLLDDKCFKGCTLKAKLSKPAADPYVKQNLEKRRLMDAAAGGGQGGDGEGDGDTDEHGSGSGTKCAKLELSDEELLAKSVTPLYHMPYEKQLKKKSGELRHSLVQFKRELLKACPGLAALDWLQQKERLFDLCCNFLPVIPSPVTKGYRNKCEFSIGTDPHGNRKTVGFRLASYKSGELAVLQPKCHIVSEYMQLIVADFQTLIRASPLDQYCVVTHTGHWRGITLRSGKTEHNMMVIVHFSPQNLSKEEMDKEKSRVFDSLSKDHPKITSFYWNSVNSISCSSSEIDQLELLGGDQKISERVLSSTFRLSPTAFFQVNTLATELLYSLVCDWAGTSADSTVMDVCCGTGTVGIILAKSVRRVIGIEMSEDAIQDAKENAKLNNLDNIQYHCGKAEEILPLLAETLVNVRHVSAVVDPPRCGLHKIVIQSLRRCSFLTQLVYVSCNARAAVANWVDLCRPTSKKFHGAPFHMVKAQPVDLFPHTNHCELVVLFERPAKHELEQQKTITPTTTSTAVATTKTFSDKQTQVDSVPGQETTVDEQTVNAS